MLYVLYVPTATNGKGKTSKKRGNNGGALYNSNNVVKVLGYLFAVRGGPNYIRSDNGPEFISKDVDLWAYWNKVKLDFSRPGKPTDNAFIESFNARFRQECLNEHWFLNLENAQEKIEAWRENYNQYRPHSSLGNIAPSSFADMCVASATSRDSEHTVGT